MAEFTHANTKKKVLLLPTNVFTVYASDDKSTHIVSISGTLLPAKESLEEVRQELEQALNGQEKK